MGKVKEPALIVDLGRASYREVYSQQLALVEKRVSGALTKDLFLITEHPSTFTLGKRGGRDHLMVSEEFLEKKGVPLVQIERGGDITFHGEGQLVLYPILHLQENALTVTDYVNLLEEVMIRIASEFGVTASRDSRNPGVWCKGKKIGSVGIAIRHGVTFHGLAINVNLSLEPFSWVNPCGLAGVSMTSISAELDQNVSFNLSKKYLNTLLPDIFCREFQYLSPTRLKEGFNV